MSTPNETLNEQAPQSLAASTIGCSGETYVRPTAWRARLCLFASILIIALGVFLYLQGLFFIGITLVTVCLAALAILAIVARTSTTRFFGHQETHYSKSPLGRYLAADAEDIKRETPTLTDEEAAAIDLHRATEAVLVNEWVVNARTPRRIQVRSDDGTSLVGRMIPGTKRERPWVLMLHGFGGTWRDSLAFSRIYAAHDCNIMLVDMRAHGESEGEWAGSGWLDRRDVIAWCSWIAARTGEEAQIIIHGQGMGATAALFAAEETDFPAQVRAIICDSAYTDAWNEATLRLGTGFAKPQPALDLYRVALRKAKGGYDLAEANVLASLQGVTTPLFIMQSEKDASTPPYMGVYLAKAAGCEVDSIVEALAAKETMADVAQMKAEAALAAEQAAQKAAEEEAKAAAKAEAEEQKAAQSIEEAAEVAESEEPANDAECAAPECDNSNEEPEAESAEEADKPQADESSQEQPLEEQQTMRLSALEVASELTVLDDPETTADEAPEVEEETAQEPDEQDRGSEEKPAEEDPFAEYPEDDLSDLFADQPSIDEEAQTTFEASPHMAWSVTGNVFLYAPSAGHCQASFACPTAYENALNEFLNSCIG